MSNLNKDASAQLRKRIQEIECDIVRVITDDDKWLSPMQSASLRWALSLARLTKIRRIRQDKKSDISLGQASDRYRAELFALLSLCLTPLGHINKDKLKELIPDIEGLAKIERSDLLSLFAPSLSKKALDDAVRRRPLSLALSGGGGTSFVFLGALYALEEAGILPSSITGSSMGAILGAYRARDKHFSMDVVKSLVERTAFKKVIQPFSGQSRFGLPATFRLYLRDIVGHEFMKENEFLQLKDLTIPFRTCVAGLSSKSAQKEEELEYYAHLMDDTKSDLNKLGNKTKSIVKTILEFAQKPVKPLYLGRDDITKEFDVLDAIGFSAAIPGVFHYDIMRNDPRMISLVTTILEKEGIFRLIDGGFVDNLPAQEALKIIEDGEADAYDPFVLALDSFAPGLNRHLLFYPIMRFAQENSKVGHETAHLVVFFKKVLSPISLIPTKDNLDFAYKHGYDEFINHMPFIRKMVGPIPDPTWLNE